jgi:TolA-binding protein
MPGQCDRLWEIDAYREGRLGVKDRESFERHLRGCSVCGGRMRAYERLGQFARALPVDGPNELVLRRLRARVLRDIATGVTASRTAVWPRVTVAIAFVGLVVWLAVGHRAGSPATPTAAVNASVSAGPKEPSLNGSEPFAGSAVASANARWSQSRERRVERVELDEGTLRLQVRPQMLGERFLVTVPEGEIEVRGTTFDVSVEHGVVTRVHVDEGVVELRLRGHDVTRLAAAEEWTALARGIAKHSTRPSASSAAIAPSPVPPESVGADDPATSFAAAMTLLRAGRNDDAASAFHAFVLSTPRSLEAEDASFLEAVALARAGRSDAAALAAEHHLASFPGSFHRKEAAILVARAAVQRGDCSKARTVLAPWIDGTPDADARAALRPPCDAR